MLRNALVSLSALALIASASAGAAPCRDAKGKFVKCPPAAAAKAPPKRCRDAHGKFTKCPSK